MHDRLAECFIPLKCFYLAKHNFFLPELLMSAVGCNRAVTGGRRLMTKADQCRLFNDARHHSVIERSFSLSSQTDLLWRCFKVCVPGTWRLEIRFGINLVCLELFRKIILFQNKEKQSTSQVCLCVCVLYPPGSALWFVLLSLGMKLQVGAAPICVHGHAGCHSLSLADLFDRVIQHSARIHGLSSDLHTEFVSLSLSLSICLLFSITASFFLWMFKVNGDEETQCYLHWLKTDTTLILSVIIPCKHQQFFFFFFLFLQEQYVPSSKNLIGERKCHTSVIQTPNGKDIAQSLTVSTFVLVCLCLLMLE